MDAGKALMEDQLGDTGVLVLNKCSTDLSDCKGR